eukprot:m.300561 g.300561  ORF g.300561 m.300561 type:complete len:67 (+) comp16303_c0_seq22:3760-3960(+)
MISKLTQFDSESNNRNLELRKLANKCALLDKRLLRRSLRVVLTIICSRRNLPHLRASVSRNLCKLR